nr:hypothetical protein [uncultured Deefgea sp.]
MKQSTALTLTEMVDTSELIKTKVGTFAPLWIEGKKFIPDDQGRWSLNEIHRELGLQVNREPSEWRTKQAALFRVGTTAENAAVTHCHLITENNGRAGSDTKASEAATIAYAMWVSDDFYLEVIEAFSLLRSIAVELAQGRKAKAAAFDRKLNTQGITPSELAERLGLSNHYLGDYILTYYFSKKTDRFTGESSYTIKPNYKDYFAWELPSGSTYGKCRLRIKPMGLKQFEDRLNDQKQRLAVFINQKKKGLKTRSSTLS